MAWTVWKAIAAPLALALAAPPVAAHADTPSAAMGSHYSSAATLIGTLLDDAAAKAVLDKYFPGLAARPNIDRVRGMTLKGLQQYKPDKFTDALLADLDADLAKLPAKPPTH